MKRIVSLLFFCVVFATAIELHLESTDLPSATAVDKATSSELEDIQIRLYNGISSEWKEVPVGKSNTLLNELNPKKSTVIYIRGRLGYYNETDKKDAVIDAYLGLGSYNVLEVNWRNIAKQSYIYAARSVESVGYTVAGALNMLVASGMNELGLHIVGHCLGAHVSGYIGRTVNFTLPRITGLDPAGFMFESSDHCLNSTDAQFVDIIHTDSGNYGIVKKLGHIDFYPNGGSRTQPGCQLGHNICSHNRANLLWAESVLNDRASVGRECSSYSKFKNGFCDSNPTEVMGHNTRNTARGEFYLQTNDKSPFGRGAAGSGASVIKLSMV